MANRLLLEWDEGRGLSKSQLEIRTWDDATSHGRHFDRSKRSFRMGLMSRLGQEAVAESAGGGFEEHDNGAARRSHTPSSSS